MQRSGAVGIVGALLALAGGPAAAQSAPSIIALYSPGEIRTLDVPEIREIARDTGSRHIRNVSVPTLEKFAPPPGKANGTAVIVAPGGGFFTLVYDHEGTAVAKRLAEQGITAFVLKYRVVQTPSVLDGVPPHHAVEMNEIMARATSGTPAEVARYAGERIAEPDAARAVQVLREHATELGIDPRRIGFIGFSAGAFLAVDVAIGDKATRPDFIGVVYGALRTPVPRDAPPAFIATAADDELVPHDAQQLFQAWRSAGRPAELHVYESGGHGFGMAKKGTTSDLWIDQFIAWMRSRQLLRRIGE